MQIAHRRPLSSRHFMLIFGVIAGCFIFTGHVSAESNKPSKAQSAAFSAICKGLEGINTENAKKDNTKYCKKKPTTVAKLDEAADDICKSYGSNKLEKQCDAYSAASNSSGDGGELVTSTVKGDARYQCGKGDNAVKTKFNFGCVGTAYKGSTLNPILDLIYAIIRFLSAGVGIVVVGSIIWAGIQYSSSQGNPEQTAQAKLRIQNSFLALVLYLFIFALVQYLVPGGLFA